MRILAGLAITTAFIATGATAQPPGHLTDVAYMEAARCAGLASSSNLGAADAAQFKALLRSQETGRASYVLDKADEMQRTAKRQADHADGMSKEALQNELSGACAQLKS